MTKNQVPKHDLESFSAFIDGQLKPEEEQKVKDRVKKEPKSRSIIADLEWTRKFLRSIPPLRAPRSFMLTPEMIQGYERGKLNLFPAFRTISVLASLLFVIVTLGDFFNNSSLSSFQQPGIEKPQTLVVVDDEVSLLEDGTDVAEKEIMEAQPEFAEAEIVPEEVIEPILTPEQMLLPSQQIMDEPPLEMAVEEPITESMDTKFYKTGTRGWIEPTEDSVLPVSEPEKLEDEPSVPSPTMSLTGDTQDSTEDRLVITIETTQIEQELESGTEITSTLMEEGGDDSQDERPDFQFYLRAGLAIIAVISGAFAIYFHRQGKHA